MTFEERMLDLLKTGDKMQMRSKLLKLADLDEIREAMAFAQLLTQHAPALHEATKEVLALKVMRGDRTNLEL